MADFSKLMKFSPLVGVYAFYNVFATTYPADPITAMKNALTSFVADPITKLKAKTSNLTTLAIVIIGVPMLTKAVKLPASLKMLVKVATYYVIGDQVAALFNGPGRFGSISGITGNTWGGQTSALHQPYRPIAAQVASDNFRTRR